ncbi:hypothetical protein QJR26_18005 (plasmid) [Clostridium baratii]
MEDIILSNISLNVITIGSIIIAASGMAFMTIIFIIDIFEGKYYIAKIEKVLMLIVVIAYVGGLIFIWNKVRSDKLEIVNSYKLEKTEEYIIDKKQYEDIRKSIYDEKNKIKDVFKSKEEGRIEKLVLNIRNGVKDKSKKDGKEKSIKVITYKSNIGKRYFDYSYPKEINILEEIK